MKNFNLDEPSDFYIDFNARQIIRKSDLAFVNFEALVVNPQYGPGGKIPPTLAKPPDSRYDIQ